MKPVRVWSYLIAFVFVLSLILTSCDSKDNAKTTDAKSNKKVELIFSWGGNNASKNAISAAINIWNKKNSDIKIKGICQDLKDFDEGLETKFNGNVAPDIVQLSFQQFQEYASKGFLEDLATYTNKELKGIDPTLWNGLEYSGKVYAVPSGIDGRVWAYNKSKLTKYHLTLPGSNETWDSIYERCKEVTRDTNNDGKVDLWGTVNPLNTDPLGYNSLVRPYGISVWTKSFNGSIFDDSKVLEVLKKFERFKNSNCVIPDNITLKKDISFIDSGSVAYENIKISDFEKICSKTKDELGLFIPPTTDGQKDTRTLSATSSISINAKCKEKDSAVKFLAWLLTDPEAAKALGMEWGVWPSQIQRNAMMPSLTPSERQMCEVTNEIIALGISDDPRVPGNMEEFNEFFRQNLDNYLYGKCSLEQFLKSVTENGNLILSKK